MTFLFGILYYFASLMDCLKSSANKTTTAASSNDSVNDEAKTTATEACYEALIQMIPQELLRAELDRV